MCSGDYYKRPPRKIRNDLLLIGSSNSLKLLVAIREVSLVGTTRWVVVRGRARPLVPTTTPSTWQASGHPPILVKTISSLLLGILFLLKSYGICSANMDLTVDLFEEGNWRACRTECSRVLLEFPDNEEAVLLKAVAELRCGIDGTESLQKLCESPAVSAGTAAMAYYELGRAMWKKKDAARALLCLEEAFEKAASKDLFLHAGCSLDILLDKYPELADRSPGLLTHLKSCSELWSCQLMSECKIEPGQPSGSLTEKPGEWLISFYRSQIGPALGRRCSLYPSCSEYARQAFCKHGLLGLALIGDRSVREPGVVAEGKSPIRVDGYNFYRDPLEEHDWWMKRGK